MSCDNESNLTVEDALHAVEAAALPPSPAPPARRYRALVELRYPTDPAIIARLEAGENVPWAERGMVRVRAGERITVMPPTPIADLIAKGRVIEEVTA